MTRTIILFGVRSPLAAEYEETCHRLAIDIPICVSVNGLPRILALEKVVDLANLGDRAVGTAFIACAFSPGRRQELTEIAARHGLVLAEALVDSFAVVASTARLGHGSFLNAGVVIGAASILGRNVLVNRSASLGHHSLIEDFASIGPGATLAGNIRVGHHAIIGAGAVIQPNIRIGAGTVVAAGSVVRRDVEAGRTVAGNPAVSRRYDAKRGSLNVEGEE